MAKVRLIAPADWVPRGIETLEDNAIEVVHSDASYSVIAGPGAGKTELLAQRASFLLETGACPAPRRVLAISFKRDAAKNLRERVRRRSGMEFARRFDSYTFDAFAKRVLDQFLPALPEHLRPTSEYDILFKLEQAEIEELFRAMSPPQSLGGMRELLGHAQKKFFEDYVPIVPFHVEPTSMKAWAARQLWGELLKGPRSKLSFKMITRLAGQLLRADTRLLRAYRSTYTHVFLDEFQDTTLLQYWLTKIVFLGSDAILTAVGDPLQRIMGWAGAVKTVFGDFEKDFRPTETRLHRNHRASAELAPLVRFLAEQMHASLAKDGEPVPAITPGSGPPPNACSAHIFASDKEEAAWIADEIADLRADGTEPREIALLTRMLPAEYTYRAVAALGTRSVPARIEDALQDLLSEPIVQCCVLALRALACPEPRKHWSELRQLIAEARGIDPDDAQRWQMLEAALGQARTAIFTSNAAPPADPEAARLLVRSVLEPLIQPVRVRNAQYARGSFYEDCLDKFAAAIAVEAHRGTWDAVLDGIEGVGTVPILTIHKSKGLEYDAVFFVGLEDGAFWNFRKEAAEEMNAFFVAVSRAKKRVVFTFSRVRTRKNHEETQTLAQIRRIYELMSKAEVHVEDHTK